MRITDLSLNEFYSFVSNHPLANHYQTMNYALLMSEHGYEHEFIGMVDEYGHVVAASLILIKNIDKKYKYGYAPRGFILDYFNQTLLMRFTEALINYYKKRKIVFIKLNPELAISVINPATNEKTYTKNYELKDKLINTGYLKLKDNLYFEAILPRFNAIVSLKDFSLKNVDKNTRNKIRRSLSKGLEIERAERSGMDILQKFIQKKRDCNPFYYKDYYNSFHQDKMIDLFLVSVNAEKYLINARELYEAELDYNTKLNEDLTRKNNLRNINKKMMSDKKLLAYKNDVFLATELCKKNEKVYVAGALVIRFQNRVQILISGYDKKYKLFDPNYFLHYSLMNYYKQDFEYIDLNGITGNFERNNPYYGLNKFKLGFNPQVYEFIGEFDLPILPRKYLKLRNTGQLAKIFNKKDLKELKEIKSNN